MTKIDHGNLARKLQRVADRTPDLVAQARIESAEDLLATALPRTPLSAKRYPSDPVPGELRSSGYADHTSIPDASEVGFSAPHAYIVHQMGTDTNWSTEGTGERFLEIPFLERRGLYASRIKDAVREGLR